MRFLRVDRVEAIIMEGLAETDPESQPETTAEMREKARRIMGSAPQEHLPLVTEALAQARGEQGGAVVDDGPAKGHAITRPPGGAALVALGRMAESIGNGTLRAHRARD